MGREVYRKRHFRIFQCGRNRYLVHNSRKPFETGHTHITRFHDNLGTAKYIVKLALYQKIPYHISDYLLESLIRVSTDTSYIEALQMQLDIQRRKRE